MIVLYAAAPLQYSCRWPLHFNAYYIHHSVLRHSGKPSSRTLAMMFPDCSSLPEPAVLALKPTLERFQNWKSAWTPSWPLSCTLINMRAFAQTSVSSSGSILAPYKGHSDSLVTFSGMYWYRRFRYYSIISVCAYSFIMLINISLLPLHY